MENKMKIKNRLVFVGFILAVANIGSVTAQAAQSCYEMEGALQVITVNSGLTQVASSAQIAELYKYNLADLNRSAAKACSGGNFCVEDSTVKHEATGNNDHFIAYMNVKTTAVVNCLK